MQLDNIIIALRQRTPWEAMDLGVMVMRKMWPIIFLPWAIMLGGVLAFSLFTEYKGLTYFSSFFMWLIKPVYESMLLFIISRGIFKEYPSVSEVYSSAGQWLTTGLKTSFYFWRLSPSRSFNMPVSLLEGLSGKQRKRRLDVLHRVKGSHASWLTIIGVHFEYVVALTLYVLFFYIAPDTAIDFLTSSMSAGGNEELWLVIGMCIYAITLFVLEPFYVAAGFMLYLNRRTELEGWDVELGFKNIAQRIETIHQPDFNGGELKHNGLRDDA